MNIKTLDSADVEGQVVVVRADLNVPLDEGMITNDARIRAFAPTVQYLLSKGAARIHIVTHVGRPKGKKVSWLSTKPIAARLAQLIEVEVEHRADFTPGAAQVQMHENTRYWRGEKDNTREFVNRLKAMEGRIFVMDAFGTAHRAHGSVVGLAQQRPAYAGLLVEKELNALMPYIAKTKKEGLTVLMGGAKIDTKIAVLEHFAKTAENILLGGALANTFLAAQGFDVGSSFYQEDQLDIARNIMAIADAHGCGFHLPIDLICTDSHDQTHPLDVPLEDVMGDMRAYDVGPHTVASYKEIIAHSRTVIWNGPLGMIENELFQSGTRKLAQALADSPAETILGGGDTLAALTMFDIAADKFTHVSTGGGAMLELLEGKELPGIAIVTE